MLLFTLYPKAKRYMTESKNNTVILQSLSYGLLDLKEEEVMDSTKML